MWKHLLLVKQVFMLFQGLLSWILDHLIVRWVLVLEGSIFRLFPDLDAVRMRVRHAWNSSTPSFFSSSTSIERRRRPIPVC
jgi:hypothetical protein